MDQKRTAPVSYSAPKQKSMVAKEIWLGVIAVALGVYNILSSYGMISWNYEIPQLIGNVILVLAGFFLWSMAIKLLRYKYHRSHLL